MATADALPTVQINGVAWSQAVVNDTVWVAGGFTNARPAGSAAGVNTTARNNILAYTLSTGNLITSFVPYLNAPGYVVAVSPDRARVYVGGDFTTANGQTHNRIAAFNAATGAIIGSFAPSVDARVKAIVATNDTVYAGGSFTTANGNARGYVAAFKASDGSLTTWNPGADYYVSSMVMAPGSTKLILGGQFQNVGGVANYGMAAVDSTTGVTLPWKVGETVRNAGDKASITSLTTDGTNIYGTGYVFGPGGNLEGTFSADAGTGNLNWVEDCHGDSYSNFVTNGAVYTVSHAHYCGNIGGYPQTDPWSFHRTLAFTLNATGTIGRDPLGYYNWEGNASPSMYAWFPNLVQGTYTGQNQAAWNVTGNSQYIVEGGEFPTVNGKGQQGLVRFAVGTPNKIGPEGAQPVLTTSVVSLSAGTARVAWQTTNDRDDLSLTYKVIRDGKTATPIYTTTANSTFWNEPTIGFVDTGLVPGSTHSYRVYAYDPAGSSAVGSTKTVTISNTAANSSYLNDVHSDGASHFWRLGESSGATGYDWAGFDDLSLGTGITRTADGALPEDTNTATFDGSTAGFGVNAAPLQGPNTFTESAWFKTTSTSGGKIIAFGNKNTGNSSNYDRHIYMDPAGHVFFGVYNNGSYTVNTSNTLNDGQWHQVAATLSSSGMTLYVDGDRVGTNSGTTVGQGYMGYWRVGGDSPWAGNGYFAGTIDEVAIYPTALTLAQVQKQYVDSGRTLPGAPANTPPTASFTSTPMNLTVAFDGSASADPDGTIASYSWDFGDQSAAGTGAKPSHPYAAAGTYNVVLTVTDAQGGIGTKSGSVTVAAANASPTASFKSAATNLSVVFDGSASSDPDGTISSYSWDFGDQSAAGTGATPSHPYAAAGTYNVVLTVTDAQGGMGTKSGSVTVAAANVSPTASFKSAATNLSVVFDGSASSDPDGTIASYSWDFGDQSAAGTGATPSHPYAAAGTYPVVLTVTDNRNGTATKSASVTVTAPANQNPAPFVTDTFARTTTTGWGTANLGGSWTTVGTAANTSVSGNVGNLVNPTPGSSVGTYLGATTRNSTDLTVTVSSDKVGTGGGTYLYVVGRRVATSNEYRARIRFAAGGKVGIALTALKGSSTDVTLATETVLSGTYAANQVFNVRFEVVGTSPTTLKLKVWPANTMEPAAWQLTTTDTFAGLQAAGAVGTTSYLSSSSTNAPVAVRIGSLDARPAGA